MDREQSGVISVIKKLLVFFCGFLLPITAAIFNLFAQYIQPSNWQILNLSVCLVFSIAFVMERFSASQALAALLVISIVLENAVAEIQLLDQTVSLMPQLILVATTAVLQGALGFGLMYILHTAKDAGNH